MAKLSSVVKDTAIYGASSIIGRFLNYLLVPLYTARMAAASGGYGIITHIYAYVAVCLVLLTFGMETTFFRFANKAEEKPTTVYSTTLLMVSAVALIFLAIVLTFLHPIADAMGYAVHPEYVGIMAVCVAIDAFQCIPFAWLRYQHRPIKFAMLKLLFILSNIGLNVLYFAVLPALYADYPDVIGRFYNPHVGVGYAFGLNLVCTAAITVFFWPELTGFRYVFDVKLMRRMLRYSWPILILGITGILNQTIDKMLFPVLFGDAEEGKTQLSIYGACVKVAMIMAMITQAFRYAYEPFVFGQSREKNNKEIYAIAMKYFIIFTLLAFLCVVGYMDLLQHLIGADYHEGLHIVPIVMAAEIMMGVYFNLSFWYKLTDRTIWGAWFSLAGCAVLITVNILFVPRFGYVACAWGGFAGYGTSMILSYIVGQHYYPITYPLTSIGIYVLLAAFCYGLMTWAVAPQWPVWMRLGCNTIIILLFAGHVIKHDFPLRNLPYIGRYFR